MDDRMLTVTVALPASQWSKAQSTLADSEPWAANVALYEAITAVLAEHGLVVVAP